MGPSQERHEILLLLLLQLQRQHRVEELDGVFEGNKRPS
jgi:hypothetical protein